MDIAIWTLAKLVISLVLKIEIDQISTQIESTGNIKIILVVFTI